MHCLNLRDTVNATMFFEMFAGDLESQSGAASPMIEEGWTADFEVVVLGEGTSFFAVVCCGEAATPCPVITGPQTGSVEAALNQLLAATMEMLSKRWSKSANPLPDENKVYTSNGAVWCRME